MLRISIQENGNTVNLKLEGRVSGLWTGEFGKAWERLAQTLGSRKLIVDLSGLTYVDQYGTKLLKEIHEKTHAEFIADTPLTKYFAEQAQAAGKHSGNGKKGA
jgi:anti-anti-sigma regulatory factor